MFEVGEDGRFIDFSTSADVGDAGARSHFGQTAWSCFSPITVLAERDKLKETQKILARSNVFPKAFLSRSVQSGRCRNDIARVEARGGQTSGGAARWREAEAAKEFGGGTTPLHAVGSSSVNDYDMPWSLSLENPPPIENDTKVVTYAMHFACPTITKELT